MNSISIYIPRVSVDCDEAFFRQFFHMISFGDVDRVDFVALDYDYTSNGRFRKAFVHFQFVYNTQIADDIVTTLSKGEPYRLYPRAGEHWILLKNKVPVLATTMNIHQLAENHRLLEEKTQLLEEKSRRLEESMLYLEEKMRLLEETVAKQDDMLDRSQQTIYQMIPMLNMSKCDERVFTRVLLGFENEEEQEDKEQDQQDQPDQQEDKEQEQEQEDKEEDDDFDFLGEDIEDNMMSFCMLEKKYGPLTFNKKTNDFTDGDGFVRYVLSKTEMLDEENQQDLFGTGPFLKYAHFCRMRKERNEREENNLKMD